MFHTGSTLCTLPLIPPEILSTGVLYHFVDQEEVSTARYTIRSE